MSLLYYINVTIHVLAAMLWLGGMFFLALVGAPTLRSIESPALRQQLFQQLGLRFRTLGWVAIAVLIATGVINLYFRGWLPSGALSEPAFWQNTIGRALAIKLGAVVVMIVFSALHDFWLGPRAGRLTAGSLEALAARRRSALLARANAILGLIIVIAAVRLAR